MRYSLKIGILLNANFSYLGKEFKYFLPAWISFFFLILKEVLSCPPNIVQFARISAQAVKYKVGAKGSVHIVSKSSDFAI